MNSVEFGMCDICKKDAPITRTYYRYAIKCNCHSPQHFVLIRHCNECKPVEPEFLVIKTKDLQKA